jgi:hypothetical protein
MASCAGGMRDRALAAQFVEAPSLAVSFIPESGGEAACVKVRAARAVLVDDAFVRESGTPELIELRQSAHGHVLQYHCQQVVRIGRAAGQVDDRLAGNHGIDAHCARGIRIRRGDSTPGSARTHGNDGRGL